METIDRIEEVASRIAQIPLTDGYHCKEIDGTPALEESYRLRYKVYCLERNYLDAKDYPDGIEKDEYDAQSTHVGLFNGKGIMIGTFRFVLPTPLEPPMFRHCAVNLKSRSWLEYPAPEVSRFILSSATGSGAGLALLLIRAVYQLCKRYGYSFFYMATDRYFSRLLVRYGILHEIIGPVVDFCGQVCPFAIDLGACELDYAIADPHLLNWWQEGLSSIGSFITGHPHTTPSDLGWQYKRRYCWE